MFYYHHEFSEVDGAVIVRVIHPPDMFCQLLNIGSGVAGLHHRLERLLGDLPVWVVCDEYLELLLYVLSRYGRVRDDVVHVFMTQLDRACGVILFFHPTFW